MLNLNHFSIYQYAQPVQNYYVINYVSSCMGKTSIVQLVATWIKNYVVMKNVCILRCLKYIVFAKKHVQIEERINKYDMEHNKIFKTIFDKLQYDCSL